MKKILGITGVLALFLAVAVLVFSIAYNITSFSISIYSEDSKGADLSRKWEFGPEPTPEPEPGSGSAILDIPVIAQLPQLPRGCEVTALAMLLNHAGVGVDKMELADKIRKVDYRNDGLYGSPNEGFVGSIYNLKEPGLGVYHKPIAELANSYLPHEIIDFSGEDFYWIPKYLDRGRPVWVIINTTYNVLPEDQWSTWDTSRGKVRVTSKEHSVLVTGYDKDYIYFNDPLTGEKNRKALKSEFIAAWSQMGKQAITYGRQ